MRILIAGAGVAGLTLAALLRRQGRSPVILDRGPEEGAAGYAMALWPQGTRVLHAVGAHDALTARGEPVRCYVARDGRGRMIISADLQASVGRFGYLGTIPRPELIELLREAVGSIDIRHGVTVETLDQASGHVDVRLTDGTEERRALVAPFGAPAEDLLAGLPGDEGPLYVWRMADVRAPHWVKGRVALVGDAAAAFLPTAGIGASMALESAAVLADEVSRCDARHLAGGLAFYVRRRRRRVEAAQDQSRWLARVMFIRSPVLARLRDGLMRLAGAERMLGPLIGDLQEPI